jgi:hypothetical protein
MSKTFEVSYNESTKDYTFSQVIDSDLGEGYLEVVEVPFHRKFRLTVFNSTTKEQAFTTLQKFISDYYEELNK